MQTIGEKLEEARKRRGIAIREASEFTKIRGEYLAGFENNQFDINLPEIYVRGFLRTYGRFLKLNPDKLITDYNAYRLGESKIARQDSKEFLGRMDLPESEESDGEADESPEREARPAANAPPATPRRRPPGADEDGEDYGYLGRSYYPKVAAALGGAVVLAGLLVFLVLAVIRSGPTDAQAAGETELETTQRELVLLARGGDIQRVLVTERETGNELFRGPMADGETRSVHFDDQVRLTYSHAQFLVLEQDGAQYELAGEGMGQSTFPATP